MRAKPAVFALFAAVFGAFVAHADDAATANSAAAPSASGSASSPPSSAPPSSAPPAASAAASPKPAAPPGPPSPKRAKPDYDGRGAPPTTVGDVAIWAPRVVFYPLYLVTDYVIRAPIGALVYEADTKHWVINVLNFFTFGPDRQVGVFPTGFFDFGLRPSVGLYGFVNKAFHPDNSIHAQVGFFGPSWLSFAVTDKFSLGGDSYVSIGGSWIHRPDHPFYGLGPNSRNSAESRYGADVTDIPLIYQKRFGNDKLQLKSTNGLRLTRFHRGDCCEDADLAVASVGGRYPLPPGYPNGYDDVYTRLDLIADSRPARPASQTGVRASAYGEQGVDPRARARWMKYGGSAGIYADLGGQRTIGLKGSLQFVDPGTGTVPFRELVNLGGYGLMRGYLEYRLIDRSAAVAEIEYRWPVWVFLDGTLQASVGNVFGEHLSGFAADLLRFSGAIGMRSNNAADHQFEMLFGLGSETFASGAEITSVRIFVGGTNGF